MFTSTAGMAHAQAYKLLTGALVPRPIAFVSTLSATGVPNCAPFSFCTVVSTEPPMVGIAIGRRDGQRKDTVVNAESTGEFVVNITNLPLAERMNLAAYDLPPDTSEFVTIGLTAVPGRLVRAPWIQESPVQLECVVDRVLVFGDAVHPHDFLIGRVVGVNVADHLLDEGGRMQFDRLEAVGRLAGSLYCQTDTIFSMHRMDLKDFLSLRTNREAPEVDHGT